MKTEKHFDRHKRSNYSKSNPKTKKGKKNKEDFSIKQQKEDSNISFLLNQDERNENNERVPDFKIAKHWEGKKVIETKNTAGLIAYLEEEQVLLSIANGSLLVLERDTLNIIKTISIFKEEIVSFAYNKLKKEIICQMSISMIRIFDYDSGTQINSFKLHRTIGKIIKIDPSYNFLAVVTSTNNIVIYDAKNFNQECTLSGHTGIIYDITFNPISERFMLYSCSEDGSVKIWNILLKKCVKSLEPHTSSVRHIQLTNDGNFLISGTFDNNIFIWQLRNNFLDTKEEKPKIYQIEQTFESMIYYTKNNDKKNVPTLLLGGENGTISEINLQDGIVKCSKETSVHQSIIQMYYSSEIDRLFLLSSEQFLIFVNVNVVTQNIQQGICSKIYPCFCQELLSIKFTDESICDFIFSSNDPLLKYYDATHSNVQVFEGHSDFIMNIAIKQNYIVTSSKDNTIRIWKLLYEQNDEESKDDHKTFQCKCIGVLRGHSETVNFADIILKKEKMVVSGSKDGSIKLWNIQPILDNENDENKEEEEIVISESQYSLIGHSDEVNVVKYSPNEKMIATGSYDKTIKIFDNKLSLLSTITGHKRGITDLSFSPYAKVLVSSSTDKTIKIWNLTDYNCLNTFEGHLSSVLKVNWVYHGTHLISSGADGLIKFWNIKTSECINTIDGHEGKIWAMDIHSSSSESSSLSFITGGTDASIVLWKDITVTKEIEILKAEEKKLSKEEDLRLLNYQGDYIEALKLSLELNHKHNFLTSFQNLVNETRTKYYALNTKDPIEIIIHNRKVIDNEIETDEDNDLEKKDSECLNEILNNKEIQSLIKDHLDKVIEIIRDYNLKLSTFFYAQVLLKLVLKMTKMEMFFNNKTHQGFKFKTKEKNDEEKENNFFQGKKRQRSLPKNYIDNLQVIKMYSDKHLDRLNREMIKAYMIDYSIEKMKLI